MIIFHFVKGCLSLDHFTNIKHPSPVLHMCTGTWQAHQDKPAPWHSPGAGEGGCHKCEGRNGLLRGRELLCFVWDSQLTFAREQARSVAEMIRT